MLGIILVKYDVRGFLMIGHAVSFCGVLIWALLGIGSRRVASHRTRLWPHDGVHDGRRMLSNPRFKLVPCNCLLETWSILFGQKEKNVLCMLPKT
jgi:hypothetical protein